MRWIAWVRRSDARGRLEAVPYQKAPWPPMTPALHEACRRALHARTAGGRLLRAGRAVLFVLGELGWPVRPLGWPPLVWVVELAYAAAARHRSRVSLFLRAVGA